MDLKVIEKVRLTFTPEQEQLIKSQIAPKATKDELDLFLYQAKRTGLDPLSRQIYAIHRANKMTIQTSIDGFRTIAERSGDYAGQSEPEFIKENGKLVCAKITVFRFKGEHRYPAAVGIAYMDEFKPKPPMDAMWVKMPHVMLAKVAEAQALRKAYPQDLSGLYTVDEMESAGKEEPIRAEIETKDINEPIDFTPKTSASSEQLQEIEELVEKLNKQEWLGRCMKKANVRFLRDFTKEQADGCLAYLYGQSSNAEEDHGF